MFFQYENTINFLNILKYSFKTFLTLAILLKLMSYLDQIYANGFSVQGIGNCVLKAEYLNQGHS